MVEMMKQQVSGELKGINDAPAVEGVGEVGEVGTQQE